MSSFTCAFDPDTPTGCPPCDANQEERTIFRCVDSPAAQEDDFASDISANRRYADPDNCMSWGCSVWADEKDVLLALKLFKPFKKKNIVSGDIAEEDGALLNTPSNNQPGHFTYWKADGVSVASKFTLFMQKGVKV